MEKVLAILSEIDKMEDFIKMSAIDEKIDKQVARELLYITQRITDLGLNTLSQ